jgi:hypothetical protein
MLGGELSAPLSNAIPAEASSGIASPGGLWCLAISVIAIPINTGESD